MATVTQVTITSSHDGCVALYWREEFELFPDVDDGCLVVAGEIAIVRNELRALFRDWLRRSEG